MISWFSLFFPYFLSLDWDVQGRVQIKELRARPHWFVQALCIFLLFGSFILTLSSSYRHLFWWSGYLFSHMLTSYKVHCVGGWVLILNYIQLWYCVNFVPLCIELWVKYAHITLWTFLLLLPTALGDSVLCTPIFLLVVSWAAWPPMPSTPPIMDLALLDKILPSVWSLFSFAFVWLYKMSVFDS